ncbi:TonB family protein [Sphingobium sp. V4]|uniref:TonB family protein n=1 Tax=Sphingobium sp. V4 TaxID=3038927 RepID=UPI002557E6DC|nr:TonB family protein [Sphingobium sp. V4]WIW87767.1 TonB family protein [Sphingobium sp. V4]
MKPLPILVAVAPICMTLIATPVHSVPPPPPFADGTRQLIRWIPGEARCTDGAVSVVRLQQPFVSIGFARPSPTQSYHFRIDEQGRPLSIANNGGQRLAATADDVGAALAASRFAAGRARTDCHLEYRSQASPLDEAPVADLMAYSLSPISGALPSAAWKRMAPANSTCMAAPRPAPLNRQFPDFDALPATPGARDWTMVGYDLDAKGRPIRARIVEGTGNRALDAASIKAMNASRFTGGARTGCLYPYWRSPATVAAPAPPAGQRSVDASCASDRPWAIAPRLTYPPAYRRRAIEGWAVVAYDVAPWGETGNSRVIASEPSAAFGEQAMQMIRAARKVASSSGATGCIELVRFVIGKEDGSHNGDTPAFPD